MNPDDRDRLVKAIAAQVLARLEPSDPVLLAPVGISGRHVHLASGDLVSLFGREAALTPWRGLRQPGQFAAEETVAVVGPKSVIPAVRVVGPLRPRSAVELSAGDLRTLGYEGRIGAGQPFDVTLAGPAGVVRLSQAGMISPRHLHIPPAAAAAAGVKDGDAVGARLGVLGRRVVFYDVRVRVDEAYALELHLDADEANACGAAPDDVAEILLAAVNPRRVGGGRSKRRVVTEEDVVRARRAGVSPEIAGALLTPGAKDALAKWFPDLAADYA